MHKRTHNIYGSLLLVVVSITTVFLLFSPESQARPLSKGDFTQISEMGFGDPSNSFAWSMAWFLGKLYVGTLRNTLETATFRDPPLSFDPYPVPVPDDLYDLDLRAQIWQYTPETDTWKQVYQSEEFLIIRTDATEMWTAGDKGYRAMTVYTDQNGVEALYVGTANIDFAAEARILRTIDGANYQALTFDPGIELPPGVQLTAFRSLVSFNGRLYTTPVATGGNVQKSEVQMVFEGVELDLDNSIFHFRPVSESGFGDETNETIFEMAAFNGYLYAGTRNMKKGYQVWKTDASGDPPYTWTPVIMDGAYRGPLNELASSMFPFKGRLYVGSGITFGFNPKGGLNQQSELIRINHDDTWQLICGKKRNTPDGFKIPLSGMGPGFDSTFTGFFWQMEEHEDWLYLGTMDTSIFLLYLPLKNVLPCVIDLIVKWHGGFDLWKSKNGFLWYPVTSKGLGNPLNYGLRTLQSTPSGLFLGTANPFTVGDRTYTFPNKSGGAEVWLGREGGLE